MQGKLYLHFRHNCILVHHHLRCPAHLNMAWSMQIQQSYYIKESYGLSAALLGDAAPSTSQGSSAPKSNFSLYFWHARTRTSKVYWDLVQQNDNAQSIWLKGPQQSRRYLEVTLDDSGCEASSSHSLLCLLHCSWFSLYRVATVV